MKESSKKVLKFLVLFIFVAIILAVTYKVYPIFSGITTEKGRLEFENYIFSLGIKGPLVIILLMFLQILLAFLPGEPVQILAGMCYGPFLGTLYILLGSFLSSLVVYIIVKKFGIKLLYFFFKKESIDKITNSNLYNNKRTVNLIMFIGFFIPGMPKDLLVYVAGLLPTNIFSFLIISTFGRLPSVFIAALAGKGLLDGNIPLIVVSYIILFFISFLIVYFSKGFRSKEKVVISNNSNSNEKLDNN